MKGARAAQLLQRVETAQPPSHVIQPSYESGWLAVVVIKTSSPNKLTQMPINRLQSSV
jgi:hypothetical protein